MLWTLFDVTVAKRNDYPIKQQYKDICLINCEYQIRSTKIFTGIPFASKPTLIFPWPYSTSPILSLSPLDARCMWDDFKLILYIPMPSLYVADTNCTEPSFTNSNNSLQTGLTIFYACSEVRFLFNIVTFDDKYY